MDNRLQEIRDRIAFINDNKEMSATSIYPTFRKVFKDAEYLQDALKQAQKENGILRDKDFETWENVIEVDGQLCARVYRIVTLKSQLKQAQETIKQREIEIEKMESEGTEIEARYRARERVLRDALDNIDTIADRAEVIYFEKAIGEIRDIARDALRQEGKL
jgi:septal ring factor EnvC (AmiA/AmiB activator)